MAPAFSCDLNGDLWCRGVYDDYGLCNVKRGGCIAIGGIVTWRGTVKEGLWYKDKPLWSFDVKGKIDTCIKRGLWWGRGNKKMVRRGCDGKALSHRTKLRFWPLLEEKCTDQTSVIFLFITTAVKEKEGLFLQPIHFGFLTHEKKNALALFLTIIFLMNAHLDWRGIFLYAWNWGVRFYTTSRKWG